MAELADFLKQAYAATERYLSPAERKIQANFRALYLLLDAKLKDLYTKMGDPPTLPEARRYNRLAKLQTELEREFAKMTGQNIALTRDTSARFYAEAAYRTEWAFDQASGIALGWTVVPADAIRASVWSEYSGLNIIKTFKKNGIASIANIEQAITQGIGLGESYAKVARRVKGAFNKGFSDAIRVVRTEAHRNYAEGHLRSLDEADRLGIEYVKKWVATLDGRTRDAHGSLDGEPADKGGNFHSSAGGVGPGPGLMGNAADDIHCRCTVVEEIDGFAPELRRIRDEGLVPYQTYKQWAVPRGWSPEKGWPVQQKAKITAKEAEKY